MLDELGVEIPVDAPVSSLRVAERQVIEIARALFSDARCLILDEPTAALSHQEVERLFAFVHRLRDLGVAIVYITHRLDEVARVADNVHVLRDGASVLEGAVADYDRAALVTAMVGREVAAVQRPEPLDRTPTAAVLRFESASSGSAFAGLDLTIGDGEVVGLYGKIGSGTAEVAEVAFGIRRLTGGTLRLADGAAAPTSPAQAIRAHVGFLPADRQRDGAFTVLSVAKNLSAPSWRRLARRSTVITGRDESSAYRRWHDVLHVRSRNDPEQPIGTLSGGNQQKVLLARILALEPSLLLMYDATRGVDVGTKAEIYQLMREQCEKGVSILFYSTDVAELANISDRVIVLHDGTVRAHLEGADLTERRIIAASVGGLRERAS
jgi:ribose transport system ATP-binding protein